MSHQAATERSSPATRADVARLAGVSTAVVSYVVNDGPRPVSNETAARVRRAIDELGYRPNISARALRRGVSDVIGLVMSDISNPFFAEFAVQIERVANASGRALLFGNSQGDPEREADLVNDLLNRRVDGLVLGSVFARPDPLAGFSPQVPCVIIDSSLPVPGRRALGSDLQGSAEQLVGHLIEEHGLSDLALVVGAHREGVIDHRERGWREALHRAGLPEGPIVRTSFDRPGGYRAGRALLAKGEHPQAILASSDLQALGVLRALHEHGLRVPEDVAVVCCDGTAESEYAWPPLTVARQRVPEMATAAIAMLSDPELTASHQLFPTDLVARRSCGCGEPSVNEPSVNTKGTT